MKKMNETFFVDFKIYEMASATRLPGAAPISEQMLVFQSEAEARKKYDELLVIVDSSLMNSLLTNFALLLFSVEEGKDFYKDAKHHEKLNRSPEKSRQVLGRGQDESWWGRER